MIGKLIQITVVSRKAKIITNLGDVVRATRLPSSVNLVPSAVE